ncbi:MAG: DUF1987 domain-containing protein [Crocinitomix sp.]|nr:DUF1987 domain-containing protein [Crocinitomix sp.]
MEYLKIEKTDFTPEVTVDCDKGTISIVGICIPEDAVVFFEPIIQKVDCLMQNKRQIIFDIYLEYFNTGFSKNLLALFMKVVELDSNENSKSKVIWKLEEGDDELRESGELFEEISKLDFEFVEIPQH